MAENPPATGGLSLEFYPLWVSVCGCFCMRPLAGRINQSMTFRGMRVRFIPILIVGLALVSPVSGHHSDAALDMESLVIHEGTLTEFSLRNPHTYFSIETTNERGEAIEWTIQMGSAANARRRGWTPDTLQLGDRVTFSAHPARDGRPYGLFEWIRNADGIELPIADGGATLVAATTASVEGIWTADRSRLVDYPGGLDQLTRRDLSLTPRAGAAMAAYDETTAENPELSCVGRPTPGPIIYTDLYPMQIQFNEAEQTVLLKVQYFDSERVVYMDGRDHPDPSERFFDGHSIGRWEGDVLVVDTRNFEDHRSPYQNGIPSGAQKYVVERYRLSEGGTHMAVEFTLEDPEYIVGSMTHRRELIYSPDMDMSPFDCDLESTRRFVPDNN
jgi:hypothetical protein